MSPVTKAGDAGGALMVGALGRFFSLLCWCLPRNVLWAAGCGEGVAKWLQCDAVLIKILLHSHNVIDTPANPNDT